MNIKPWICAIALAAALPATAQHVHEAPKRRTPALAIGAAFSPGGELWIVGLDRQSRLFVQSSTDEGRSWRAPRHLDIGGDKVSADGENRPKLAFGPNDLAVISYTEPLDKPYTGRIRMLRSSDGGKSFSSPVTVHRDQQIITHRFESIAFDAQGTLHTVWIDKRDLEAQMRIEAAARSADAASNPPSGKRSGKVRSAYRGAAIYRNESSDGGLSFGPDIKLADHSCECCRIALAPAPDGSVVAMWRHVFEPNQRDHAFAGLRSGSDKPPMRASLDRWAIDACPHHGPGLTPRLGGGYHTVWFGVRDGSAQVRYGQLHADGSVHGEARALPDEGAEHAAIQSAGARLAIAWRSFDGQVTRWRAWLSGDDGKSFVLKELGRSAEDNDHPLLLRRGQDIFALWRTSQGVQVERLLP